MPKGKRKPRYYTKLPTGNWKSHIRTGFPDDLPEFSEIFNHKTFPRGKK
jgi:uncharacterized protein (DUF3820 family)